MYQNEFSGYQCFFDFSICSSTFFKHDSKSILISLKTLMYLSIQFFLFGHYREFGYLKNELCLFHLEDNHFMQTFFCSFFDLGHSLPHKIVIDDSLIFQSANHLSSCNDSKLISTNNVLIVSIFFYLVVEQYWKLKFEK